MLNNNNNNFKTFFIVLYIVYAILIYTLLFFNNVTFINNYLLTLNADFIDFKTINISETAGGYCIFCFLGCWCLIMGLLFYFFNYKNFSFFSFQCMLTFFYICVSNPNNWFEKDDYIFIFIDITFIYLILIFFVDYYYFRLNNKFCIKTIITDIKIYVYTKYLKIILCLLFVIIFVIYRRLLFFIIVYPLIHFAFVTNNQRLFLCLSLLWIIVFFC